MISVLSDPSGRKLALLRYVFSACCAWTDQMRDVVLDPRPGVECHVHYVERCFTIYLPEPFGASVVQVLVDVVLTPLNLSSVDCW